MSVPNVTYHEFESGSDVLRNPRSGTPRDRTKRALLLTAGTLLIPGSTQIAAGSRILGRIGLVVTVACWFTLLLGGIMYLTMRNALLSMLTEPTVMWVLTVVLVALAIGWLILWFDTFRLIRFGQLQPGLRAGLGIVLVLLTLLTSGGLAYAAHLVHESRQTFSEVFNRGPSIPAEEGRYNFLLMGSDNAEDRESGRPDSIHVVSMNENTAETIIISIPRNFQNALFSEESPMREIYPEGYNCGNECIINFLYSDVQQNYAHLYPEAEDPGAEAMMDAVSGSLDLPVEGYVMIDMDGFTELIDAMGGITIESEGWVPYRGRPMDGGEWGDQWFEPGTLELDGENSLAFARSRDFSNDYNRVERQQCVQQAMIGQFNPRNLLTRFTDMMEAGENLVETNLPQSQLGSLLGLGTEAQENKPQRLTLGAPDFGSSGDLFSTYPDFDEIHTRVDELIANESDADGADSQEEEAEEDEGTNGEGNGNGEDADNGADNGADDDAAAEDTEEDGATEEDDETPPGPTPDHTDPAVADDEGEGEQGEAEPTQPDGSELTAEYLVEAQQRGETAVLEEAAENNGECTPVE